MMYIKLVSTKQYVIKGKHKSIRELVVVRGEVGGGMGKKGEGNHHNDFMNTFP